MAQRNSTLLHEKTELSLNLSHCSPIYTKLERESNKLETHEYDNYEKCCKKSINSVNQMINAQVISVEKENFIDAK